MRAAPFAAFAILVSVAAQGTELDAVASDFIIEQLACLESPNPTPAIAYLARERYLELSDREVIDSVSCWSLRIPFDLNGIAIKGVCAAEEGPLIHALYPDLYQRGPGTSPGTLLSVSTSLPEAALQSWGTANGIAMENIAISDLFEGMTQVECNSFGLQP